MRNAAAAASAAVLAGFLAWQFAVAPDLQRETLAREAETTARQVLADSPEVHLVEVTARYTRAEIPGQNTLLVVVHAQRATGDSGDGLEPVLAERVRTAVRVAVPDSTPLVDVTVLEP